MPFGFGERRSRLSGLNYQSSLSHVPGCALNQ
jgi:hypothetical protein